MCRVDGQGQAKWERARRPGQPLTGAPNALELTSIVEAHSSCALRERLDDDAATVSEIRPNSRSKSSLPRVGIETCTASMPKPLNAPCIPVSVSHGAIVANVFASCSVKTRWCNHNDPNDGTTNHGGIP